MNTFLRHTLRLPREGMPFWMTAIVLIVLSLLCVLAAFIFWQRNNTSPYPRVHIFQGMDNQPKYKAQAATSVFADRRAMRPPVVGTVARGAIIDDDHYLRGYGQVGRGDDAQTVFFEGMPQRIKDEWFTSPQRAEQFLALGEKKFNAYCYTCHGLNGHGQGPTHHRASLLMEANAQNTSWVPPANLAQVQTDDDGNPQLRFGHDLYPDGQLFNTIMLGKNNMAGYGHQLGPENGWAVVAYVRALQMSQFVPASDLPADQRDALPIKNTVGQATPEATPEATSEAAPQASGAEQAAADPPDSNTSASDQSAAASDPSDANADQARADMTYWKGYEQKSTPSGISYRAYVKGLPDRVREAHYADAQSAAAHLALGREVFESNCVECHTLGDGLLPIGTDSGYAGGRVLDAVVHGTSSMEPKGDLFNREEIWAVVAFVQATRRVGADIVEATPEHAMTLFAPQAHPVTP